MKFNNAVKACFSVLNNSKNSCHNVKKYSYIEKKIISLEK